MRIVVAMVFVLGLAGMAGAEPSPLVLQVQTLDGQAKWLTDFKGHVILLNFWSTTCPPCRLETPWFVEFQSKFQDQKFTVLAVSMDDDPARIKEFMKAFNVNYPMMVGREVEERIQTATGGIWGLPTTYLIGRDGRVIQKHLGLQPKVQLEKEIANAVKAPIAAALPR
ncbi:MAG: TlpA disulfide reductase family protein [Vicinamibacterales bacterium]